MSAFLRCRFVVDPDKYLEYQDGVIRPNEPRMDPYDHPHMLSTDLRGSV
jgi:hypothetical protein